MYNWKRIATTLIQKNNFRMSVKQEVICKVSGADSFDRWGRSFNLLLHKYITASNGKIISLLRYQAVCCELQLKTRKNSSFIKKIHTKMCGKNFCYKNIRQTLLLLDPIFFLNRVVPKQISGAYFVNFTQRVDSQIYGKYPKSVRDFSLNKVIPNLLEVMEKSIN